jgi:hypothetical protein
MGIELKFRFGLEVGDRPCRVLDTFLPAHIATWRLDNDSTAEFYPFLVVVESSDGKSQFVWLPYWHVVADKDGTVSRKYGQWAPFMDTEAFGSLLSQARAKGYQV